ncbi:unnamed protein product [Penicillium egyptiacum]|uniref:Zn(2)-C6 fungal-type domain-containing protein n=1 Tax=Penicillium egyptiacum TaxID=1303716 RepID=A0A9W4KE78_9EURO|nr:unnamed protein product [Penicillium egyptiacum]
MEIGSMAFANLYGFPSDHDLLNVEDDDYSHGLGASMLQSHIAFPYPLEPLAHSGIFAPPSAFDVGLSSTLANKADPQQLDSGASDPPDRFHLSQAADILRYPQTEIDQQAQEKFPTAPQNKTPASKRGPRRLRRQNHSCDPCRSAKRACDLPPNANHVDNLSSSPCSMCKLRGTDCTVVWRASKQSHKPKKSASVSFVKSHSTDHDLDSINKYTDDSLSPTTPNSLSSHESVLVCHMMTSETCAQKLDVYIDIFDDPMSKLLSKRCMAPCYSLGIAALTPLSRNTQLAAHFSQAQSSIKNSWEKGSSPRPTSAASRLFLTASILDSLFQSPNSHSKCARSVSRDNALIETYKWVAIATGSQFSVNESDAENMWKSHKQTRDVAYATWCKAKHMVFENIANKSFRLGLSLLLFGIILPPTESDKSCEFEEDAAYALHEGLRRLHTLCAEARAYLQNCSTQSALLTPLMGLRKPCLLQNLSTGALENVLELIAAFEWLVEMLQSVAISLFPCRSFTFALSIGNFSAEHSHSIEKVTQRSDGKSVDNGRDSNTMDDAIIARVTAGSPTVTVLWSQGFPEHLVHSALLESGSVVILVWKALARLTLSIRKVGAGDANYTEIHHRFNMMTMLIDLWRTTFGTVDHASALSLQLSTANVRRGVLFCATDGNLGVLLFYELCCQLQRHLEDQPQSLGNKLRETLNLTRNYSNYQRLTSAMQISYLTSATHGLSSPGFQGEGGLKSNIEDIRAHPHPTMVVQAHRLAAKCFAEEIQNSVHTVDIKRISDLSASLESCLRELQGLQNALVMYPGAELGDENVTSS